MKTLWILAAAATFAACSSRTEEDVGAAPDIGDDTTAVTTEVDTATGQWDTTSTTGDVNVEPSDTAWTDTTPSDTTVGQYPTPDEALPDTTMTSPDTGAYVPDTSTGGYDPSAADPSAGAEDPGVDSGMGTDTTWAEPSDPADPSAPADPSMPADSTYPSAQ